MDRLDSRLKPTAVVGNINMSMATLAAYQTAAVDTYARDGDRDGGGGQVLVPGDGVVRTVRRNLRKQSAALFMRARAVQASNAEPPAV